MKSFIWFAIFCLVFVQTLCAQVSFRVLAVGDSTTYASNPRSWFYTALAAPEPGNKFYYGATGPRVAAKWYPGSQVIAFNWAYSGYKLSSLDTQASDRNAMINITAPTGGGRPTIYNILACRIGTNHDESDAAVYAAIVRTHYLAAQAAGWLVIHLPMWDKRSQSAFVQAYNAATAGWTTSDGVAAVVPATEALLYATDANLNTTYFLDNGPGDQGIHPTQAGHNLAARDFLATLNTLIVSLGGEPQPTTFSVASTTSTTVTLNLGWPANQDVVYDIYYSTTDSFVSGTFWDDAEFNVFDPVPATRTVTGLTTATPYYFWVRPRNFNSGATGVPTIRVTATP